MNATTMDKEQFTEYAHARGMMTPSELVCFARFIEAERRLDSMPSLASIQQAVHGSRQTLD